MITSLEVKNFRGIKNLKLENLGQINIIAGKNNAGKSSVLEALSLFLSAPEGAQAFKDILQEVLIWRGWYGPQTVEDLFYKKAQSAEIAAVQKGHNALLPDLYVEQKSSWQLTLKKEKSHNALLPDLYVELRGFNLRAPKLKARFPVSNLVDPNVLSSFLLSAKFEPGLNFEFITPLTLRKFGYVESLYSFAYERKVVKNSVKVLKEAYPEVEGFSPLFKANKWILHVETRHGVYPYYLMGGGFKNAMIIAFLSSLLKSGYLLIDSAEAFHHPASLKVMAKTIIKGVKENKVQVFLTTHSLELIDILIEYGAENGLDGKLIYMKREGEKINAKVEPFEKARELREILGLDLRG